MLFHGEARKRIRAAHPELNFVEVSKRVGEEVSCSACVFILIRGLISCSIYDRNCFYSGLKYQLKKRINTNCARNRLQKKQKRTTAKKSFW